MNILNFKMAIICGKNSFRGFVSVGAQKFAFEVASPEKSQEPVPLLKVDWRLQKILGSSLTKFLEENEFDEPAHFYKEFSDFINRRLKINQETEMWLVHPAKTAALVKALRQEIKSIQQYVKDFDIASGIIRIEVIDAQLRTHIAVLKLSHDYKIQPIGVLSHDLPLQRIGVSKSAFNLDNLFSVSEFCKKFLELVTCFQQFWNMTTVIDSQCCVLDPLNPTFKDNFRRIKLSNAMSVLLTFNPFCSCQMPNIKLLGCQSDVNYYHAILQKNLENELWDPEADFIFNLSNVLEISIPNKIYTELSEAVKDITESGECAICFSLKLENNAPTEMCENSSCKSVYHSKCLFTYLSSIPRNRDYFGKIQGECPNCEDIIICTVPKLM